jgi:integrase
MDVIFGTHRTSTYLDDDPRIQIDPRVGALHEIHGRLELGPPKTIAGVRTVHLPPFLATLLTEHRERNPHARYVFTGANGGLHRRSNFRRRVWLPALAGNPELEWGPINPELHFHDLRHTHKTWLVEDGAPRVLRLERLGHKRKDVDDHYSHVTRPMIKDALAALQRRWEQFGGWSWTDNREDAAA